MSKATQIIIAGCKNGRLVVSDRGTEIYDDQGDLRVVIGKQEDSNFGVEISGSYISSEVDAEELTKRLASSIKSLSSKKEAGAEMKISPEKISIAAEPIMNARIIPCCPIGRSCSLRSNTGTISIDSTILADRIIEAISDRPIGIKLHELK